MSLRRNWSAAEDAALVAAVRAEEPLWIFARTVGRTAAACYSRVKALRAAGAVSLPMARGRPRIDHGPAQPEPNPRGRATRACLCCGAPFASAGPHNRLCPSCRGRSSGAGAFDTPHFVRYR